MVYYSDKGPWREENSLTRVLDELGEPPEIPTHENETLENFVSEKIDYGELERRERLISGKIRGLFSEQKRYLFLAIASTIPLFITACANYKQIENSENYLGGAFLLMVGGILAYRQKCAETTRMIANYFQ